MTSDRDDEHDEHDDLQLDAFLRGEDDLSALLAGAVQPAPPADLDARILAQARAALGANGAANDAAGAVPAAPRKPRLWRLRTPLALAATLVFGVSLSLHWTGPRKDVATVVGDDAPAAPAPAAAPAPMPAPMPAPKSAPAAPPTETAPDRATAPPVSIQVPDLAPATVLRRAAHESTYARSPAPAAPEDAANAANAAIVGSGSRAAAQSTPGMKGSAQADTDAHAQHWLALIARMLDRARGDDAVASWDRFRTAYPDYPAPEELRARIEAARARPVGAAPR